MEFFKMICNFLELSNYNGYFSNSMGSSVPSSWFSPFEAKETPNRVVLS